MIPYVLTASEGEEELAQGLADIEALEVAKVYGEALLNAAEQEGQVEEVLGELEALLQTAAAPPGSDLRRFLASGVIGRRTRDEVLEKAFAGRAHPLLVNFLRVLNDHDRMTLLPAILFQAKELRDRRARRLPVFLHSAVPLADDQVERVRQTVRERLNLEPLIENKVEPDLLGGILLRVGDWVFDGTVRTRIQELGKQLIERSSYEIQSGRDRFSTPG
jgi:F-type H+-transporting ATPase subunit delta